MNHWSSEPNGYYEWKWHFNSLIIGFGGILFWIIHFCCFFSVSLLTIRGNDRLTLSDQLVVSKNQYQNWWWCCPTHHNSYCEEETTITKYKVWPTVGMHKCQWNGMKGKKKKKPIPMKIRTESISNSYENYKKRGLWTFKWNLWRKERKKLGKTRYGIQRWPTKERTKWRDEEEEETKWNRFLAAERTKIPKQQ